jgi:hypothetical protein
MSALRAVILCGGLLLLSAPAHAQGDDARAKQHFSAGTEHFRHGRYDQARAAFSAGYELSHKPGFLWNMAECARLSQHHDQAIALYRQYLEEAPLGSQRAQAQERLDELSPPVAEPAAPVTSAEPVSPKRDVVPKTAPAVAQDSDVGDTSSRPIWVGILLGGVGGAGITTGVILEVAGALTTADIEAHECAGGASSCTDELVAHNDTRNALVGGGIAALTVGALATGAMVGYLLWPEEDPNDREVAVAPWASPDSVGASVGVRW